jgi:hypothetical protein
MFESRCERVTEVHLPEFTGLRVMMMPIVIGEVDSLPPTLNDWKTAAAVLFASDIIHNKRRDNQGKVGYLTIDEKEVLVGQTHRRAGLHIDGGRGKGWGGGSGGWAHSSTGMLTVSNIEGCHAWLQDFDGEPGDEGNCEHLRSQLKDGARVIFHPNVVYWASGHCVHESIPQPVSVKRQFVRLSLPSDAPWFEGYTENPLGIKPTGEILPRREYMDA